MKEEVDKIVEQELWVQSIVEVAVANGGHIWRLDPDTIPGWEHNSEVDRIILKASTRLKTQSKIS